MYKGMLTFLLLRFRLQRLRLVGASLLIGSTFGIACSRESPVVPSTTTATAAPAVTDVSPGSLRAGESVTITVTGANFERGATTVAVGGAGLAVSNVSIESSTSLTATLSATGQADIGAYEMTVSTRGGTSAPQTIRVTAPPPVSASTSPISIPFGKSATITVSGSGFVQGATTATVSGNGVVVTGITVSGVAASTSTPAAAARSTAPQGTTAIVNLSIADDAAPGTRWLTLTTDGGSVSVEFTIAPPIPGLSHFTASPSTITRGNSSTLIWSGITHAHTCTIDPRVGLVACSSGSASVSPATTTTYTLTLSGPSGTIKEEATIAVGLAPPTLGAVAPTAGVRGTTVPVTLTGSNFATGLTTVLVSGGDISVANVVVSDATSLRAEIVVPASATLGPRTVTVTTPSGTSGGQTFTVQAAAPTLMSISPASAQQGSTVVVTLSGSNFVSGSTSIAVGGADVTVGTIVVNDATSLSAEITVGSSATLGARSVTVTTPGGTSGTQTFTVTAAATPPTLTGISPAAGTQGATIAVTLTGTHFASGSTTVAVGGSGVTVSGVSVASATSLTASFAIGSTATTGARTVTVTTPAGTSGTHTFTVNAAAGLPTLTAISPNRGSQGTTARVLLTGTNFVGGATTVAVSGIGVTVSNVSVSSATSLTADFVLGGTASTGPRGVTVTTAAGTSGARTFTINQPSGSETFSYTGGTQIFLVPAGVTRLTVDAYGAQGGNGGSFGGLGASGGRVTATIGVAQGETLQIVVGGAGGNGFANGTGAAGYNGGGASLSSSVSGGGGGGASDVRQGGTTTGHRVVVAGGGGGGGARGFGGAFGGHGGSGGQTTGFGGNSGAGPTPGQGGGAGTPSAGGPGGSGISTGTPGQLEVGGDSGLGSNAGGGGGGGYYGGGGGGNGSAPSSGGGGGGGGSSYATATATAVSHQGGIRAGNGQVVLTW